MATLNGFIRAANASYRRAARENERYAREAAKRQKENLKQMVVTSNVNAVQTYNKFIEELLSIHTECSETLNWKHFLNEPEPIAPLLKQECENMAHAFYKSYRPSFFDKLFGSDRKKFNALFKKIEIAKQEDLNIHSKEKESYKNDLQDWKKIQSITKGVMEGNPIAYKNAVEFFDPFSGISDLGSKINCSFFTDNVILDVYVNSEHVIPDYVLTYTTTGKLSNKKMSVSRFNELYQDYVCSCVIRVSREIFALLPVKYVNVNAICNMLNTRTGHMENTPILKVKFDSLGLSRLNFKTIDCSDSISNFPNQMKFSKTKGFLSVETSSEQKNFSSIN